jgi:hypothetical protein
MANPVTAKEVLTTLRHNLRSRSDLGLGKAVADRLLEPPNPFEPALARKPQRWFVLLCIILVAALGAFVYFSSPGPHGGVLVFLVRRTRAVPPHQPPTSRTGHLPYYCCPCRARQRLRGCFSRGTIGLRLSGDRAVRRSGLGDSPENSFAFHQNGLGCRGAQRPHF